MALELQRALREAARLEKAGKPREAARLYTAILRDYPGNRDARQRLARLGPQAPGGAADPLAPLRALYRRREFRKLVTEAQRLALMQPRNPALWSLMGAAEFELGRPDRAETAFGKALALAPDRPASHNNLGMALRAQGKLDAAREVFVRALALNPDYADAHNNLGLIHQAREDWAAAETAFARATALNPADADAWTNLGNTRQHLEGAGAIEAYRKALAANPDHANAHYNLALALRRAGTLSEVAHHYREAVRCRPDFAMAWNNLGNVLQAMGQLPAAETALRKAVELDPQSADAWNNLGIVFEKLSQPVQAIEAYDRALAVDPGHEMAQAQRHYQLAHVCDWSDHAALLKSLETLGTGTHAVMPLPLLAMEDNPARQCRRSELYVREKFGDETPAALAPLPPARAARKLRIGYFSADFRNHPVARLIAGTLAAHDYDRYDFYGYSFGPVTQDALRSEISGRFREFLDIRQSGDDEAHAAIRAHDLDIAVDLTGFTMHSRTQLFRRRLAPVQINYLGFPSTIGARFMDYIVVDPVLVPAEERAHLTESLIVMPHCYQPNDDRRPVPEDDGGRAAHGLPEDALVLCCFNNSFKITPREFDIWMRVMQQAPETVLWLLKPSDLTAENLRRETAARGVDPDRLVFADRVDNERHLARHRHADLFIDTFAYNAHTTASDALWMGLPVLTLAGRQFAARVGASIVASAGLPELITRTEAEYEARILELVRDPAGLAALRGRLDAGRATAPLFDTEGYTRALERAFETVHRRRAEGLAPADLLAG